MYRRSSREPATGSLLPCFYCHNLPVCLADPSRQSREGPAVFGAQSHCGVVALLRFALARLCVRGERANPRSFLTHSKTDPASFLGVFSGNRTGASVSLPHLILQQGACSRLFGRPFFGPRSTTCLMPSFIPQRNALIHCGQLRVDMQRILNVLTCPMGVPSFRLIDQRLKKRSLPAQMTID